MSKGTNIRGSRQRQDRSFLALNLLFAAVTVALTVVFVLPGVQTPVLLLKYPRTLYVVLSFAALALWIGLSVGFLIISRRRTESKGRLAALIAGFLQSGALIFLTVTLAISTTQFAEKLGKVQISNAEELAYLRNYSEGSYELSADIDCDGLSWKSVDRFGGTLTGNGHAISNLTLGEKGLIDVNDGEIDGVCLKNPSYEDFAISCGYGSLAQTNNGLINACKLLWDRSADPEQAAKPCATFLVGINKGRCTESTKKELDAVTELVEHSDREIRRKEATCLEEGIVTYRCAVCQRTRVEALEKSAHNYAETERKEATCSRSGTVTFTCVFCGETRSETLLPNKMHDYVTVSYQSDRNHNICKNCYDEYYGYRTELLNWVVYVAGAVLLLNLIIVAYQWHEEHYWRWLREKGWFWVASVMAVLALLVLGGHFYIATHQTAGEQFYDAWLVDPPPADCQFKESSRIDPTYTSTGEVTYVCTDCGQQYTETLPMLEVTEEQAETEEGSLPIYSAPTAPELAENEPNGKLSRADTIPIPAAVTGFLSDREDADYYAVSVPTDSRITVQFSHEADGAYSYWNLTVLAADGKTVLKEGYLPGMDAGETATVELPEVPAGLCYIMVSAATGGNPLLIGYSDADYHLSFAAECLTHAAEHRYLTKGASCTEPGESVVMCDTCGAVLLTEEIPAYGHRFGNWILLDEGSLTSPGSEQRICAVCGEEESLPVLKIFWLSIYLLIGLAVWISDVIFIVQRKNKRGKGKVRLALTIALLVGGVIGCLLTSADFSSPYLWGMLAAQLGIIILMIVNIRNA